jgi:hypothetical protein
VPSNKDKKMELHFTIDTLLTACSVVISLFVKAEVSKLKLWVIEKTEDKINDHKKDCYVLDRRKKDC